MLKPYYQTENGVLYHGDCLEIMPHLPMVDLVLTDIPYGGVNRKDSGLRNLNKGDADTVTFLLAPFMEQVSKNKNIYVFCGTEQVSEIIANLVDRGFSTRLCIWEKTNPSPMNGKTIFLSGVECCVYGKKTGAVFNGFCKNTVFRHPIARDQQHPTQKPTVLIGELITLSSNRGDTVLDPCMGSGTTAFMCEKLGRKWIGIEISEKYCEIAAKRIEAEYKQRKLF